MKERVVVAMSGGVDSAVAAALLKEQGYEVIGMTMCFSIPHADAGSRKKPTCCGLQGIEDARRIAHKLGIRHYVLNMQKALWEHVIKDFCAEYLAGRTPNPCVRCNQYLKFDALLKKALSLDAKYLATGHYAKIVHSSKFIVHSRVFLLKKAKDRHKDQSYFLYHLGQNQLKHILFPLGNYTKEQVRGLARKFALPVADKIASQEICFLPGNDYRPFLRQMVKKDFAPGPVVDKDGVVLGRHKGIAYYTIGQREGLGIAKGYPIYITEINPKNNRITVGRREDVFRKEFLVSHPHFIVRPPEKKIAAWVKIRYNHKQALAKIMPLKDKIKVTFKKAQFAVTPGQSAVFYDKDIVLGGGIIHKTL
jgi:tRNA-specific 2-thiouridylase